MSGPLRFAINALSAVSGGGTTYFEGILPALAAIDATNQYLLLKGPGQDYLPPAPGANFEWHECAIRDRSRRARILFEQGPMVRLLRERRIDVLYSPAELTTLLAPCRVVLALRNASAYGLRMKMGLKDWRRNITLSQAARLSAWRADRVIFVSETSRQTITRQLWIRRSKTEVIHHGIHPAFRRLERRGQGAPAPTVTRPYILSVSQIRRGKNYPRLVEAFALLVKQGRADLDLVIIGGVEDTWTGEEIERIVEREGLHGRVHLPGQMKYAALPDWYAGAELFVFPSLLETFGHPLVEAMATGLPVIAADATSNPEILGGAGILFDPWDVPAMAAAIARVLDDPVLARNLSERSLSRSAEFSWGKSARKLLEVLESTIPGPRH